jgi:hypothetical protein
MFPVVKGDNAKRFTEEERLAVGVRVARIGSQGAVFANPRPSAFPSLRPILTTGRPANPTKSGDRFGYLSESSFVLSFDLCLACRGQITGPLCNFNLLWAALSGSRVAFYTLRHKSAFDATTD